MNMPNIIELMAITGTQLGGGIVAFTADQAIAFAAALAREQEAQPQDGGTAQPAPKPRPATQRYKNWPAELAAQPAAQEPSAITIEPEYANGRWTVAFYAEPTEAQVQAMFDALQKIANEEVTYLQAAALATNAIAGIKRSKEGPAQEPSTERAEPPVGAVVALRKDDLSLIALAKKYGYPTLLNSYGFSLDGLKDFAAALLAAQEQRAEPQGLMTDEQILACLDDRQPVRAHHGAAVFEYRLFALIGFARRVLAARASAGKEAE